MESGSLHVRVTGQRSPVASSRRPRRRIPSPRSGSRDPVTDAPGAAPVGAAPTGGDGRSGEPLAVVCAGPPGQGRSELIDALLETTVERPRAPAGSFLVVRHGERPGSVAYVPGYRQPLAFRPGPDGGPPVLARPPRRIELTRTGPLLRHVTLVDTPDTGILGAAGVRVVREAVRRGGALLFVVSAGRRLHSTDLDLLGEVSRTGARVFVAVTPDPEGAGAGLARCRAELSAAAPALADADWYAVGPTAGDAAALRRALVDWAAAGDADRGSAVVAPTGGRAVRVLRDVHESDWEDRLDRMVRSTGQRVRQHLALEVANIHLRCVQEIVFGSGCAGLPDVLDREFHALSLLAVAECDAAADRIMDELLTVVFGGIPDGGVRQRVTVAVRRGFADHRLARDLDRLLLVTSTGGVASLVGPGALAALPAGPTGPGTGLLPPVGVALSGGCYQLWRDPDGTDAPRARSWLQRVLREVEVELSREVSRRLESVGLSLGAILSDAVDHGILLA